MAHTACLSKGLASLMSNDLTISAGPVSLVILRVVCLPLVRVSVTIV